MEDLDEPSAGRIGEGQEFVGARQGGRRFRGPQQIAQPVRAPLQRPRSPCDQGVVQSEPHGHAKQNQRHE